MDKYFTISFSFGVWTVAVTLFAYRCRVGFSTLSPHYGNLKTDDVTLGRENDFFVRRSTRSIVTKL